MTCNVISPHRLAELSGALYPEPVLMINPSWFVLFSIRHNDIWKMHKQAEASFWTTKEVDHFQQDCNWCFNCFQMANGKCPQWDLHLAIWDIDWGYSQENPFAEFH
jgi:hypothetical protein